jgi:hypothetical protein
MRASLAGLLIVCLASTLALSQEPQKGDPPPPPIPFPIPDDLSYFENVWGLKKKDFAAEAWHDSQRKLVNNRILTAGRFVYVLEFTRDIHNYDLDTLKAFLFFPDNKIRHVFFDADNVAINSMVTYGYLVQGEVSGVKGDSLRVVVDFGHDLEIMKADPRGIVQARKLAARRGN